MKRSRPYRIARYVVYRQTILRPSDNIWTFLGAFFGIGTIGYLQSVTLPLADATFLIGSFGATAVLIYGATNSPLAQPRNLFGGHIISAFVGVSVATLITNADLLWLSAALAVSCSIFLMQISKTLHPPGGATALIAVIGSEQIQGLGYLYILFPVLSSISIMFMIALIFNNIPEDRCYPAKPFYFLKRKNQ